MHVMDILTKLCLSIHNNFTTLCLQHKMVYCALYNQKIIQFLWKNISRLITQFLSFDVQTNFEQICEQDIFFNC